MTPVMASILYAEEWPSAWRTDIFGKPLFKFELI
jgi:hypothetical protein